MRKIKNISRTLFSLSGPKGRLYRVSIKVHPFPRKRDAEREMKIRKQRAEEQSKRKTVRAEIAQLERNINDLLTL